MEYNRKTGMQLLEKYLINDKRKYTHSVDVGNCTFMFADILSQKHLEIKLNKELVGFLGFTHDIGQSITTSKHELRSIELLIKENVPIEIAMMVMHGQLLEQFKEDSCSSLYKPVGYEGKILTISDMSIDPSNGLISIEERAEKIKAGVRKIPNMLDELKHVICNGVDEALPRFQKYRDELFGLMEATLGELHDKFEREYKSGL